MTSYELKLMQRPELIAGGPFVNIDKLGNGNHPICRDIGNGMYESKGW
jgi:hypothetical protein